MKHLLRFKTFLIMALLAMIGTNVWAQSDFSDVETSNVTLTAGTNGSSCAVNENDGIKVGTGSKGGDMSVTVPAGTTHLHLHAAAWKGVSGLSLNITGATVSPTSISLTADDGITYNSPFTLSGSASDFYFVLELSNITAETTLKFTTSSAKRFVIWGVNAEEVGSSSSLTESDFALTGTPVALSFDLYNNATPQVVNYTTSSTGAVSIADSEYATFDVDATNKTITVTPVKRTKSAQTITVSQAADETYAAGSATFTVNVDDSTPRTGGWVETDIANLAAGDVFVIVGNNGNDYALSNDKGTDSAPSAVEVTVSGDAITSIVDDNIKWNISGNATNGYVFYPNESTETWLYCTNANNGLRVGEGSANAFVVKDDYLYNSGQGRYIGVYNSQDWRSYTSINNNIKDQTFKFYKYEDASSSSKVSPELAWSASSASAVVGEAFTAPTLTNPNNVTVTYESTNANVATVNESGEVSVVAAGETTIKAVFAGDETYKEQTVSYTLTVTAPAVVFTSLKDLQDNVTSTSQDFTLQMTDVYVTAVKTSNAWITDGTYGALIYTSGHGLTAGQKLNGTLSAKYVLYRGQTEITDFSTSGLTITEEAFAPVDVADLSILSAANQSLLVTLKNVTYDGSKLSDGTNTITPYTTFMSSLGLESGKTYDITGIVVLYNTTLEIAPRTEADIVEVGAPVVASIAVDPNVVNATSAETDGTIAVTYNNITTVVSEVKFYEADGTTEATYDWLEAEINAGNNVYYVIDENTNTEARTAYLKVYALDDDANDVYSELITINQAAYVAPALTEINLTKKLVFDTTCGLASGGYTTNDDLTILSGTFEGDENATRFGGFVIKDAYINGGSIQMKASSGSITFPVIKSEYGFDVTVAYKTNEAIVYINGSAATEAPAGDSDLRIATGSKYCQITSITLTPKTSEVPPTVDVEEPVITAADGHVTIVPGSDNVQVIYTTDGTDPTYEPLNGTVYTDPFNITVDTTVKAIGVDADGNASDVVEVTVTAPAQPAVVVWNEDWSSFDLTTDGVTPAANGSFAYAYTDASTSTTKLYNEELAGCSAPELLICKSGGSFTATIPLYGAYGNMKLTFQTNNKLTEVRAKVDDDTKNDITVAPTKVGTKFVYELPFSVAEGANQVVLTFANSTSNNVRVDDFKLTAPQVAVKISAVEYATMYYASSNLVVPAGVTVSTYKLNGDVLAVSQEYTEGDVLPKAQGYVLNGAAGSYTFAATNSSAAADTENLLLGSDEAVTTVAPTSETPTEYLFYLLGNDNGKVGFYWGKDEGAAFTSGAHKAYLAVPAEVAAGVRGFTFDGTTVGINTIGVQMPEGDAYDLQGRRVQQFQKGGLYIVGGKKMLAK